MESMSQKIERLYSAIEDLSKLEQTKEIQEEIHHLKMVAQSLERKSASMNTAWDKVTIARKIERPRSRFYIQEMVADFIELHGDRAFKDDPAIIGGIGKIGPYVVTIIAQNKGTNAKENIESNFGMAHPEGYRKALRLMKQAEKFKRPIVCLIDTPGAYCGIGAEERGQGEAIARNLLEMSRLKTPIIAGIIGEGGSGGALALGVADCIFMLENTTYSILSPEGFASILWKDSKKAEEAAKVMKITASDLKEYQIIDDIIKEPGGGAHKDPQKAAAYLKEYLILQLEKLIKKPVNELISQRYQRFRQYGVFSE